MTYSEKLALAAECRIKMFLTGTDGHYFRGSLTREQAAAMVQFFSECEQMIARSKHVAVEYEI